LDQTYRGDKIVFAHNTSYQATNHFIIHSHATYEIYYFLSGDVIFIVGGHQYVLKPHTVILIPPDTYHGMNVLSNKPFSRFFCQFSDDVIAMERRRELLRLFPSTFEESTMIWQSMRHSYIPAWIESILHCNWMTEQQSGDMATVLVEALIVRLLMERPLLSPAFEDEGNRGYNIKALLLYVNNHFTEKLSLEAIASHFYISTNYLNRVFRKEIGSTVMEYICTRRITYAKQLLINGITAAQAAVLVGFGDYSSFYRAYKKRYQYSPSKDYHIRQSLSSTAEIINDTFKADEWSKILIDCSDMSPQTDSPEDTETSYEKDSQ